ncbi:serine hydrolase [Spongiimicrobium salis]|uniref:serine hydrolase n=1 Tax=Spongiimicrobium salis TaxID=1667022 RepID=UPI00374D4129
MYYILKCIAVLIFFLLASLSAKAQIQSEAHFAQKLETYLGLIHDNLHFNGEVLVAKGNRILFQEVKGYSAREHQLSLRPGQKYKIASITKSFTGVLIGIAIEEGKLNFKDKVIQLIPTLSPKFKDITIAQLLHHTSGLPHNEGIAKYWPVKSKLHVNTVEALHEINTLDLLFDPGTGQHYSSLGYYLLATVLEKIYGEQYDHILQNKIFKKLQLTRSGSLNSLAIRPQMVSGYHLVKDDSVIMAPYRNYSMLKGAGDLYSTTVDLHIFNTSFFSNDLLQEKTKERIFNPDMEQINTLGYGMGWYVAQKPHKSYAHGGGTWGFSAHNAIYPKEKISIVILSNISRLPMGNIARDIEKIVFGAAFDLPRKQKEQSINTTLLEHYTGVYRSITKGATLSISRKDDRLFAQLGKKPSFEIYAKGDYEFFGKKIAVTISFENENDSITGCTAKRLGKSFYFKKELK